MTVIDSSISSERYFLVNSPDKRITTTYSLTSEEIAKSPFLIELVKKNKPDSKYVYMPTPIYNGICGTKVAQIGLKYLQTGLYKDNPKDHLNQFLAANYLKIDDLTKIAARKLLECQLGSLEDNKLSILFDVVLKSHDLPMQISCFHTLTNQRTPEQIEKLLEDFNNSEALDDLLDVAKRVSNYNAKNKDIGFQLKISKKRNCLKIQVHCLSYKKIWFGILRDTINRFAVGDLNLRLVKLNNATAAHLSKILKSNTCVHKLDMSDCQLLTPPVLTPTRTTIHNSLAKILRGNSFIEIYRFNHIVDPEVKNLFTKLAQGLSENPNPHVKAFSCRDNALGTGYGGVLAKIISPKLEFLDFKNTELSDSDGVALAEGLSKCTLLREVNLSQNKLGSAAAKAIAESIKGHVNLKTLDFGHNNIGDEGFIKIAAAVEGFLLENLVFCNNDLGDDICDSVRQLFKLNTGMKCLDLEKNGLGTLGLKKISLMLRDINSRSQLQIKMNGNKVSPEIRTHFEQTKAILAKKGIRATIHRGK